MHATHPHQRLRPFRRVRRRYLLDLGGHHILDPHSPSRYCQRFVSPLDCVYRPAWVITTTLSRTVIRPSRDAVLSLFATVNETGLSPDLGMLLVMVIQETCDCADHTHRSCVAPPHTMGSLC